MTLDPMKPAPPVMRRFMAFWTAAASKARRRLRDSIHVASESSVALRLPPHSKTRLDMPRSRRSSCFAEDVLEITAIFAVRQPRRERLQLFQRQEALAERCFLGAPDLDALSFL